MISCRYVGSDCSQIGEREFDTVGQMATFSESLFRDVVLGQAHFITEADFKRCGFSDEELRLYGASGSRFNPTQSFIGKIARAQEMFRDMYSRMLVESVNVLADASNEDVREPEPFVGQ